MDSFSTSICSWISFISLSMRFLRLFICSRRACLALNCERSSDSLRFCWLYSVWIFSRWCSFSCSSVRPWSTSSLKRETFSSVSDNCSSSSFNSCSRASTPPLWLLCLTILNQLGPIHIPSLVIIDWWIASCFRCASAVVRSSAANTPATSGWISSGGSI